MFRKHWQFTVVLTVLVAMATVMLLSAPIFPVETIILQTRTISLQYTAQDYKQTNVPRFVNVTNTASVGGVFSVTLELSEGRGVVGGVEFTTKETTLSVSQGFLTMQANALVNICQQQPRLFHGVK